MDRIQLSLLTKVALCFSVIWTATFSQITQPGSQPQVKWSYIPMHMAFYPRYPAAGIEQDELLFICRGFVGGLWTAGKLNVGKENTCTTTTNGGEVSVKAAGQFQLLTGPIQAFSWVKIVGDGSVPPNSVVSGLSSGGSRYPQYVCRGKYTQGGRNDLIPGKYGTYYKTCFIVVDGQMYRANEGEILTINGLGIAVGSKQVPDDLLAAETSANTGTESPPDEPSEESTETTTTEEALPESTAAPEKKTTAQPGKKTTAEPGNKSTAEPGKKTTAEPGNKSTAEPGRKTTAQPGKRTTAQPGKKSTAQPGRRTTAHPEKRTTAQPGKRTTAKPNKKTTAQPNYASTAQTATVQPPTTKKTGRPARRTTARPGNKKTTVDPGTASVGGEFIPQIPTREEEYPFEE